MNSKSCLLGLLLLAHGGPAIAQAAANHAEGGEWVVHLNPPGQGQGATPSFRLHLTARAGFHVNTDYPMSFRTSADSTISFASAHVALHPSSTKPCGGHAKEVCSATMELPASEPFKGERRLSGTFAFSVCSAERCLIEKVPLLAVVAGES